MKLSRVVFGAEEYDNTSPVIPLMSLKATKESIVLTLETGCDQTALGLPPVTSADNSHTIIPLTLTLYLQRNSRDMSVISQDTVILPK
jgi:hypothetical protein